MPASTPDGFLESRPFNEISIGDRASITHCATQRDIDLLATVTGHVRPLHVDPGYAADTMILRITLQGMWGAGLISAVPNMLTSRPDGARPASCAVAVLMSHAAAQA